MHEHQLLEYHLLTELHAAAAQLGHAPSAAELTARLHPEEPERLQALLDLLVQQGWIRRHPDTDGYLPVAPPLIPATAVQAGYRDVQRRLVAQMDRAVTLLTRTRQLWNADPPQKSSPDLNPAQQLAVLEHDFFCYLRDAAAWWRTALASWPAGSYAGQEALEEAISSLELCQDVPLEAVDPEIVDDDGLWGYPSVSPYPRKPT